MLGLPDVVPLTPDELKHPLGPGYRAGLILFSFDHLISILWQAGTPGMVLEAGLTIVI